MTDAWESVDSARKHFEELRENGFSSEQIERMIETGKDVQFYALLTLLLQKRVITKEEFIESSKEQIAALTGVFKGR